MLLCIVGLKTGLNAIHEHPLENEFRACTRALENQKIRPTFTHGRGGAGSGYG